MRKWVQPLVALVILCFSVLLLSTVFDNLGPYQVIPQPQEDATSRTVHLIEERRLSPPGKVLASPGRLVFAVSPADPVLYWRASTLDYYDGLGWYETTRQITTHEFPSIQGGDASQIFIVELNTTEKETSLPVPPPQTDIAEPVLSPSLSHEYYFDETADTCGIRLLCLGYEAEIVYQASWHHTEIDKWRVTLDDLPQSIRNVYLQLPSLPREVVQLAEKLRRPGTNAVDQILSDVAYFITNFEYDLDYHMGRTRRVMTQDWVLSYLTWGKGVCLDAATALAVILRCQGIPSRISVGYKPTTVNEDKILYYSNTSHAETEAYLPPYGWVRFDATPFSPLDSPEDFGALRPEKGLKLEIFPPEAEGFSGESVFYHLVLNNSRETKDHFELSVHSTNGWSHRIAPEFLAVGAFETCDALVEVKIPQDASCGQMDMITVTANSTDNHDAEVSNTTIARAGEVKRTSTTTSISYINNSAFRGDSFYVEGSVATAHYEPVHEMQVLILLKKNKEAQGVVCGSGFSQHGLFRIEGQVPFDTSLGDHFAVAISLGTKEYAPSSSDPLIKVLARTYIKLSVGVEGTHTTRPFLVEDHILISGILRLDNGTRVSDAALGLELLAPGSSTVGKHEIIAKDGFFMERFLFSTPGAYELNATFLGEGYVVGSHYHRKIEVGSPAVQSLAEDYCVRGEVLKISGNVSSHNSGIPEEPVTITIDGNVVATVETEFDGRFFCDWQIDSEVKPGLHFLACCLQKRNGIGVTQYVRVMVKAQVLINAPEKVTAGESLTCTISICDDHGLPIAGEEISVGRYGLSSKTDAHGNIELLLDTLPFWWGNTNVTVAFQGSNDYLPSTAFAIVAVQPGPVSILYVLATSALFILGLILDRGTLKRLFPKAKHDKEQLKEIAIPTRREVPPTKVEKTPTLRIEFPDIQTPFPNVWGVKDNLRIECTLDEGPRARQGRNEVELFVNSERIAKDRSSKREPSTFSYVFNEKGEHEVMARAFEKSKRGSIEVKTNLRVVDYREEIIRLFKAFFQHLIHQHINLKDDMTAREIEHLLVGGGDSDPKSLHKVIDCFERAEYSDHEIGRESYEMMYLSLTGLITDVD